jgi:hypothetical protein
MDFGTDYNNNKEEFLRCSTKIVVSGRSVWDVQKLNDFVEKIQSQPGSDDWLYFIPMAGNKLIQNVKSKINRKEALSTITQYRSFGISYLLIYLIVLRLLIK